MSPAKLCLQLCESGQHLGFRVEPGFIRAWSQNLISEYLRFIFVDLDPFHNAAGGSTRTVLPRLCMAYVPKTVCGFGLWALTRNPTYTRIPRVTSPEFARKWIDLSPPMRAAMTFCCAGS